MTPRGYGRGPRTVPPAGPALPGLIQTPTRLTQDDVGSYLRATANYTDGEGFGKSEQDETGRVTAVRPDGRVTLSSSRPEVGLDLTASLNDPDGGVTGLRLGSGPGLRTGPPAGATYSAPRRTPTGLLRRTWATTCGRRRPTPTLKPPARPPRR